MRLKRTVKRGTEVPSQPLLFPLDAGKEGGTKEGDLHVEKGGFLVEKGGFLVEKGAFLWKRGVRGAQRGMGPQRRGPPEGGHGGPPTGLQFSSGTRLAYTQHCCNFTCFLFTI